MDSLSRAFACAASPHPGLSTFWLLVFAIAILDDAERREEQRQKRKRQAQPQRRKRAHPDAPPIGPRPSR